MTEARIEARKEEFKKGIDAEGAADRRQDRQQALRKKKREEKLAARRGRQCSRESVMQVEQELGLSPGAGEGQDPMLQLQARIGELVQGVMQDEDRERFTQSLEWLRVLSGSKYMISEVFGAQPFLARMVQVARIPDAQVADKALTILTNAAMIPGAEVSLIRGCHVFQLISELLTNDQVPLVLKSSAAWLLANLVTTDVSVRDAAIHMGMHAVLAQLILAQEARYAESEYLPEEARQFKENAVWCTSNFFKGHEPPDYRNMAPSMQVLRMGLFEEEGTADAPINQYAVWAVQYASKDIAICHTLLNDPGVMQRLVFLCMAPNQSVRLGAMRTMGELVTYEEDEGGQLLEAALINTGMANVLSNTLQDRSKLLRHESCFVVANMAMTSWRCMHALAAVGIVDTILRMCDQEVSDVRGEAMRAMCNVTHAAMKASTIPEGMQLYQRLVCGEHLVRRLAPGLVGWNVFVSTEIMRLYLALLRRGTIPSIPEGLRARDIFNALEESGAYETIENDLTADVTSAYATLVEDVYSICQELAADEEHDELPMLVERPAPGFNPLASSGSAWGTGQYSF